MDRNLMNISKVESYLNSIIDNVVSDNTFVGTLPSTIKSEWKDMVLIDCSDGFGDYDAYGRGYVLIWLYVKPNSDGTKNVAHMSRLESRLNEVIQNARDPHYIINRRGTYQDYDDARQWHCNIVEININIV